jgi:large subunit ribosomal protein L23
MKAPYEVIETVLITEKNAIMQEQGKYVFKVKKDANKIDVANAVEQLFEVKVAKVNIMNYDGKKKRVGKSLKTGKRPDWKKAVVTLSEGEINLL